MVDTKTMHLMQTRLSPSYFRSNPNANSQVKTYHVVHAPRRREAKICKTSMKSYVAPISGRLVCIESHEGIQFKMLDS